MNNWVIITHKSTGEQKTYSGDYGLISNNERFIVYCGPFKAPVFIGSRGDFFIDIESLDDGGE